MDGYSGSPDCAAITMAKGLRFTLHLLRTFRYESDFRYPSREFYALGFLRSVLAWGLVQIVPSVSVGVSLQQAMSTPDSDGFRVHAQRLCVHLRSQRAAFAQP